MATNTRTSHDHPSTREDLQDIIYNIDPYDTPFMTMAGRLKAANTYHEWQTESLPDVNADNAAIEGDDAVMSAPVNAVRIGNNTQISTKSVSVSGTDQATTQAGIKNALAHQKALQGKGLKIDCETILLRNQARSAGSTVAARRLGGVPAFMVTNTSFGGGGGANPTGVGANLGTTARADGTQRAFEEGFLLTMMRQTWSNGGNPTRVMMGPVNKDRASGFTGIATKTKDAEDKRTMAAVDVYVSNFGTVQFVPNRFQRERDVFGFQPEMWAVAYLRPMFTKPLARTGDRDSEQMVVEYTLVAKNESSSFGIFDLTDT